MKGYQALLDYHFHVNLDEGNLDFECLIFALLLLYLLEKIFK